MLEESTGKNLCDLGLGRVIKHDTRAQSKKKKG